MQARVAESRPADDAPIAGRRIIDGRSIRWNADRAAAAYAAGDWVHETLADALARAAEQTPDRLLLIDGEVRLDAAAMQRQATALADRLAARMPRGSVVSFMLPNWHEAAVLYLASTLAGMVANPILPSLRDRELGYILADAGSRMIVVPGVWRGHDYPAMLDRVTAALTDPPEAVVVRGDVAGRTRFETLTAPSAESAPPLPALDQDAVRMILYTSGTTGRPKGVLHTHNSLHALTRQIGQHWQVAPGDVFLVPSPISHIGGSLYAFETPLLLGATAVLMDRWDAGDAVRLAERHGCTHMAGATPFLDQMLAAAQTAQTHLPKLKVFICGGASVPPVLIRRASDWFEQTAVTRVYGSTEVPVTTVGAPRRAEIDLAAETDGRPGIAEVRLGAGGEVLARGPQMLAGYLHVDDEAAAFDEDGFYRTGDLGVLTPEGALVITGRAKDLIIRKGENIAPKEVEDALVEHPAIREAAVVGLPDAVTGERAWAVLVTDGTLLDIDAVAAFLRLAGLASFKLPEAVAIWPALPKNDAGKVLKDQVRARLADGEH
jgi:acyl-CoA synthetase (AMP-forming)/AMP-acid ligase II